MVIRQQLLRPAGEGVAVGPVPPGLGGLWIKSDASKMGVSGARDLLGGPKQGFQSAGPVVIDSPQQTHEFFIYFNSVDNEDVKTALFHGASSTTIPGWRIFIRADGRIQLEIANGTDRTLQTIMAAGTIVAGKWYHFVLTLDRVRDMSYLYLNAEYQGSTIWNSGQLGGVWNSEYWFGCHSLGEGVHGRQCRVRSYDNRLFGAGDVRETFNYGNGLTFAELPADKQADCVVSYNAVEATGPAIDNKGSEDLAEFGGPIGHGAGPRVATAVDTSGNGYTANFVGGLDPITSWSTDTPSGTHSLMKRDSGPSPVHGVMLDFSDFQAAHIPGGGLRQGSGGTGYVNTGRKTVSGEGARTLAVRLKTADSDTTKYVIDEHQGAATNNPGASLTIRSVGLNVRIGSATGVVLDLIGSQIDDDVEHTVVFRWDGTTDPNAAEIFVDGSLDVAGTCSKTSQEGPSSHVLQFMQPSDFGNLFFEGDLFEVAITSGRAWTDQELADFEAGTVPADSHHWKFDEPSRPVPHTAGGLSLHNIPGVGSLQIDQDIGSIMSGDFTFATWAKFRTDAPNQALFGVPVDGIELYKQQGSTNRQLRFNPGAIFSDLPIPFDWIHLTMRYTEATETVEYFFDGLPVGGGVVDITPTAPDWFIGGYNSVSDPLTDANIDYTLLYQSALSNQDIENLANGLDPIGDVPTNRYPLDDGPQGTIPSDGEIITSVESAEGRRAIWLASSANQRPQWFASPAEMNGRPSLFFDGIDDFLEYLAKYISSATGTAHIMLRYASNGRRGIYSQGETGRSVLGMQFSTNQLGGIRQDSYTATGEAIAANVPALLSIVFNGTTTRIRLDGVEQTVSPSGSPKWFDAVDAIRSALGSELTVDGAAIYFMHGYVPEIIIYDRELTAEEIDQNEAYLAGKYQ